MHDAPRRNALALILVLLLVGGCAHGGTVRRSDARPGRTPPNVVLIVSDDQGYNDLGVMGSDEALTPNLDRLARQGVLLTSFYVAWPACTPSRGALLTGRYPQRNGVYDMIRNEAPDRGHRYTPEDYAVTWERIGGMATREILIPRALESAGHASGIFGKWDLGMHRRFLPLQRGFDQFYGFVNSGIDYYTHERYGVPSMYRDNEPTERDRGTYATDLFLREALRFLEENRHRHFFLYVPFNAPHGASNLDPAIRGAAQATPECKARFPHLEDTLIDGKRYGKNARVPSREKRRLEYLAAVSCMDDAIGAILDALDEHEIADDTLVIFLSDNGGGGGADNGPLRGGKGSVFEGGVRVPCIVRFPGRVPAGTRSGEFLTALEVFPTILAAAGVEPPGGVVLDGFDMLPVLAGDRPSERETMFWKRRGLEAARVGQWKWIRTPEGVSLFDLESDIGEQQDVASTRPEKAAQLESAFESWRESMDWAEPKRGPFRDF